MSLKVHAFFYTYDSRGQSFQNFILAKKKGSAPEHCFLEHISEQQYYKKLAM